MSKSELEKAASLLEATGQFKVLRKLGLPDANAGPGSAHAEHVGVIVDVETTGLDPYVDQVIELGMLKFAYGSDGAISGPLGRFCGLAEPSCSIPARVVQLTGITDEMVAGERIDPRAVCEFLADASIVIAHNALFDRPFCETVSPAFLDLPWACSLREIDWTALGHDSSKLSHLLSDIGLFADGHRAEVDCAALFQVLSRSARAGGSAPFASLLASSRQFTVRLYAERAPYDQSSTLKLRGYRWSDGSEQIRAWWIEVSEGKLAAEVEFLRRNVYSHPRMDFAAVRLGAHERYANRLPPPTSAAALLRSR